MTRMDVVLSPEVVRSAVRLTLAAHRGGRRCRHCTASACEQLAWARSEAGRP
ncbi:hypothetical protein [Micromonospora fluostatini]|uniref:hypothetical protein n=1 Tax=Micromonospora sp. JCM 30529 TaxID=3421643 RepID=UPI003D16B7E2